MPFRARMKRAFTRSSSSSSDASSSMSKVESRGIGDPKIYQPGEQMPRPKYRAPVDKKHKAMLESFSFSNSSRRKSGSSGGSLYSPMGSRMPSRNNSIHRPAGWWNPSSVEKVVEGVSDHSDTSNVGGASRRQSNDLKVAIHRSRGTSIMKTDIVENIDVAISRGNAHDHTPFTEDDIHDALTRGGPRTLSVPHL